MTAQKHNITRRSEEDNFQKLGISPEMIKIPERLLKESRKIIGRKEDNTKI